jgi:hypothetical protein
VRLAPGPIDADSTDLCDDVHQLIAVFTRPYR